MKKNEIKNLRTKNLKELQEKLAKERLKLLEFHAKLKAGREKNPRKGNNLRRNIAQTLTLIREKEIVEQSVEKKGQKIEIKKT